MALHWPPPFLNSLMLPFIYPRETKPLAFSKASCSLRPPHKPVHSMPLMPWNSLLAFRLDHKQASSLVILLLVDIASYTLSIVCLPLIKPFFNLFKIYFIIT